MPNKSYTADLNLLNKLLVFTAVFLMNFSILLAQDSSTGLTSNNQLNTPQENSLSADNFSSPNNEQASVDQNTDNQAIQPKAEQLNQEIVKESVQSEQVKSSDIVTNTTESVPAEQESVVATKEAEKKSTVPMVDPLGLGKGKKAVKGPVTINGDNVEYSVDSKEVSAEGNVSIVSDGVKLTCDKLTVNTETKEAVASGNVKLEDKKGIIEGEKITYNFLNKTGMLTDAKFRSTPYYGKAEKLDKVSEEEFIAYNGYMSSCDYDHPHYRLNIKRINFFPGNKVEAKGLKITAGQEKQIPLIYLPQMNQQFKDRIMKIQMMPGKSKEWGYYMLSAWRYNLTENIKGRIFLDYRSYLGVAQGFDTNYKSKEVGTGDFKFYYTQERDKSGDLGKEASIPKVFQRYFVRWRHKWDIDERTNYIHQYYKIVDSKRALFGSDHNFLKDYFPREFDKDPLPLSYIQVHHAFDYSSLDMVFQKRVNPWYSQLEELPKINYSMPSVQLVGSPFYLENSTEFAEFKYKNAVPSPSTADTKMWRSDFYNKLSLPMRVSIFSFTPYVADRTTYYNSNLEGSSIYPRTIFSSGADVSTKLYRIYDVKSDLLGLNINSLRHIITPTIGYGYMHRPTISPDNLKQIDGIDSLDASNGTTIELSNKLQTKRNGQSVDLLDFRIETGYTLYKIEPLTQMKTKGGLSNFELNLDVWPYTWMTLHGDAEYDSKQQFYKNANGDLSFNFGKDRSIGLGHRYERKAGKEMTFSATWRINPKWKVGIYDRYQFANLSQDNRGLRYQQYTVSRDLHCWVMEMSLTQEKGKGSTIWMLFRLKAFPEIQFDLNQSYAAPKAGSGT